MNREQYLAKQMWLHGAPAGAGHRAANRQPLQDDASPWGSRPASLSDYYQRFHRGASARHDNEPSS